MDTSRASGAQAGQLLEELQRMGSLLSDIRTNIKSGYRRKKEAVFLPVRAADWPAMEGVWRAASADPEYTVRVIPLPWHYVAPDLTLREEQQWEAERFPAGVPITDYRDYPFSRHIPDIAVIQNPCDRANYGMSVEPQFYSSRLRGFVRTLVYIPWFATEEIDAEADGQTPSVFNMRYYATAPGVVQSDLVFVQSDAVRRSYIKLLTEMAGEDTREIWEKKVSGTGSPLLSDCGGKIWEEILRRKGE